MGLVNQLKLRRNLRYATTYQVHMPYVAAYVVPDVEGGGAVAASGPPC
jgi:hypothetical protein